MNMSNFMHMYVISISLVYIYRKTSKLLFITWLPVNSTSHAKMAYTSGKGVFKESNYLQGVEDVNATSFADIQRVMGAGGEESDNDDSDFEF